MRGTQKRKTPSVVDPKPKLWRPEKTPQISGQPKPQTLISFKKMGLFASLFLDAEIDNVSAVSHSNTSCVLHRSHHRQLPACNQLNLFVLWQIQRESILSERSYLTGSTLSQKARCLEAKAWKLSDGITYPTNNEIFEDQMGTSCEVTIILLLVSPGIQPILHSLQQLVSSVWQPHNQQGQAVPWFIGYLRCYKELDPKQITQQPECAPLGKQLALCLVIPMLQTCICRKAYLNPFLKLFETNWWGTRKARNYTNIWVRKIKLEA